MTPGRAPVVYIAATGRSGSTLLARLLGAHRGFLPVGELRYLWQRGLQENHLCGCGAPFRDCSYWEDVLSRAFGGVGPAEKLNVARLARHVDRIRHIPLLAVGRLRSPGFQRVLDEYAAILSRLYSSILTAGAGSVVVDSSKDASYGFLLGTIGDLDVSYVHLIRDSRAVAYSWTRHRLRPEIHWATTYMRRRPPVRSGLKWNQHQLLAEALQLSGSRLSRLRYEDLVEDPDTTVARVAAMATAVSGSPVAPEGRPFPHDISGNPMRFETPRSVRADMEWRTALPGRDRRAVTLVTAPLLLRYGYLP